MPELRRDPLTDDWVLYSESRRQRPEDFEFPAPVEDPIEDCPFEPGREDRTPPEVDADRPGNGDPSDWVVRVVPNKFPALTEPGGSGESPGKNAGGRPGRGTHEVVIETPHHEREWHRLSAEHMHRVLEMYRRRVQVLGKRPSVRLVQLFKNRGGPAGATLSHPHAQILTLPVLPSRTRRRLRGAGEHYRETGTCFWCDTLREEIRRATRLVVETDEFAVWCPRVSRYPYELRIVPKDHAPRFDGLSADQQRELSHLLPDLAARLEDLLRTPPYNVILHTAPQPEPNDPSVKNLAALYHWHLEILPRVSRTAGLELATDTYLHHTPPETAAGELREHAE